MHSLRQMTNEIVLSRHWLITLLKTSMFLHVQAERG